jgi:hypothetical protein
MKLHHNELTDTDSALISDENYLKSIGSKRGDGDLLSLMAGEQDSLLLEVDFWKVSRIKCWH